MNKKVLLIADDEEMNRRIISKFLKENFDIIEAENGRVAMDILHRQHVDALLLDIIMPEMDGLEVLETMRKEPELDHVGVLVATSTKERTERTALSLGADDVVSKPYDPVVIRKRMQNIIALKDISLQKEQLQRDDIDGYLRNRNLTHKKQATDIAEKIIRFADILIENVSNHELAEELSRDIKLEAEKIIAVYVEE